MNEGVNFVQIQYSYQQNEKYNDERWNKGILSRANELGSQGRSKIHLEIGCPDFDSPICAKGAACVALDSEPYTTLIQGFFLVCVEKMKKWEL